MNTEVKEEVKQEFELKNLTVTSEYGCRPGEKPIFCYHAIRDQQGITLGSVWGGLPIDESERIAKLWASAPSLLEVNRQLLEALRRAKSTMERDKTGGYRKDYNGNDAHEEGSTYLLVCKAISKAETTIK